MRKTETVNDVEHAFRKTKHEISKVEHPQIASDTFADQVSNINKYESLPMAHCEKGCEFNTFDLI